MIERRRCEAGERLITVVSFESILHTPMGSLEWPQAVIRSMNCLLHRRFVEKNRWNINQSHQLFKMSCVGPYLMIERAATRPTLKC